MHDSSEIPPLNRYRTVRGRTKFAVFSCHCSEPATARARNI
jgi:hypothetical protein